MVDKKIAQEKKENRRFKNEVTKEKNKMWEKKKWLQNLDVRIETKTISIEWKKIFVL